MKKTKKFYLLFLVVLFLYDGIFPDIKSYPLKGIDRIYVLIESLPQDAIDLGLTKNRLRTATELRLKREGIKIGKEQEMIEGHIPYLYVRVNVLGIAFNIELNICENVVLLRDKSVKCNSITWDNSTIGFHGRDPEYIVTSLNHLLDKFLNDYYKANPKK